MRLTSGEPLRLETPQGDRIVSPGEPVVLKTRRPDLQPTDNALRCGTATATTEQPGLYASAAVDGDGATSWVTGEAKGAVTADLGQVERISEVSVTYARHKPASSEVLTSVDGKSWRKAPTARDGSGAGADSVRARYIKVTVEAANPEEPKEYPGVAELKAARPDSGGADS